MECGGRINETASFLAQQAAGKALKSLLYYIRAGRQRLMTHSNLEMPQAAAKRGIDGSHLLKDARGLDLHYIPARYPNGLPSGYPHKFYGRETAEEAHGSATRIFDFITEYLRTHDAEGVLAEEE